jgi:hypothetical protein
MASDNETYQKLYLASDKETITNNTYMAFDAEKVIITI